MEKHFEQSDKHFDLLLGRMDKKDQEDFIEALKTIDDILSR